MAKIRFYISGNDEVYLRGDVEYGMHADGDMYVTLDREDVEEFISKLEDVVAEVMYGSTDDVS